MNRFFSSVLVSQLQNINTHFILITIKDTPAKSHKNFGTLPLSVLETEQLMLVGRDLRRSPTPTSCLKQGQDCLGFRPAGFENLQEMSFWEIWSSAWQLSGWRKFSLCQVQVSLCLISSWTILCFSWWPLSLVTCICCKEPGFVLLCKSKEETKELDRETSSGI